jgi:hypothetical protein
MPPKSARAGQSTRSRIRSIRLPRAVREQVDSYQLRAFVPCGEHDSGNAFTHLDVEARNGATVISTVNSYDISLSAAAGLGLGRYSAEFQHREQMSSFSSSSQQFLEITLSLGRSARTLTIPGIPKLTAEAQALRAVSSARFRELCQIQGPLWNRLRVFGAARRTAAYWLRLHVHDRQR